ncbi:DNA polymerase III subunit chi [Stella sp.]|uniref:DNA polymerase III subunit chi n=1 Tax=Stella sp. TaxID=2912054 RepID=UPI0035AF8D31
MTEIGFYHLTRTPLERALPRLLEKVAGSGRRAVVLTGSEERAEALNALLWTYDPGSFLPHGTARDGNPGEQPIWLTPQDENPNGATVLVLVDGMVSARLDAYERCLDLFDGNDPDAVAAARERWREAKQAGHALTYWQQTDQGGWQARG